MSLRDRRFPPMKATAGELPAGTGWAYEVKWDGMRIIAVIDGDWLRLDSANLIEATARFPELGRLPAALGARSLVLDGEVVAFDEAGRPDFGTLQSRMHVDDAGEAVRRAAETPISYAVFDLLHLDGHDTMELAYVERRRLLEQLVEPGDAWLPAASHTGDGAAMFDAVAAQGLEGLIAKRLDSTYELGRRSRGWRKVKVRWRQELVVGGWLPGEGNRSGSLGALLLGYYDGDRLHYAGRVGSGFDTPALARLAGLLGPLATDASPFAPAPPRDVTRRARYVRPELVVEVAFGHWTADDRLRHPVYLGLRTDREPSEVIREPDPPLARPSGA